MLHQGTRSHGLFYSSFNDFELVGYSDNDGAVIVMTEKHFPICIFMGDIAFSWMSKKQSIVILSTCEAEYVATSSCVGHAIWLRSLLKENKFT